MKDKELKSAITILRKEKETKTPSEPVRYNSTGETDRGKKVKFTDAETAAMQMPTTTGQLYRIKIERTGKFYNPTKASNTYRLDQQDRTTKDLRFQYKTVSQTAFGHYVRFLQTRYESSLLAAEREVR
jgi:hypothetical protein